MKKFKYSVYTGIIVISMCINNVLFAQVTETGTITVTPTLPVSVVISESPSGAICSGTNVTFTATATNGGTTPGYQWYLNGNPVGTNSATYSNSSLANGDAVYCVLTSSETCATGNPATSGTITTTVNPSPVAIISPGNVSICSGQDTTLTASGGSSYLWSSGDTTASISVSPVNTITYTVTVSDSNCTDTEDVTVTVNSVTANAGDDTTVCAGSSIIITASGGAFYLWSSGGTTASISVSPVNTTTYSVTVSNSNCADTDDIIVVVLPLPTAYAGNDTTVNIGENVQLTATGGTSYQWVPGDYLNDSTIYNPISIPTDDITYIVYVTDLNGCTDSDTIKITVDDATDIYIPEIFSPNGDFVNDTFYVRGHGMEKLYLCVYDRWGEKVFESPPGDNLQGGQMKMESGWDGTYKGKKVFPAVFVYYVEYKLYYKEPKVLKGSITLVR